MSKLTRESIEKAEKLLKKKQTYLEGGARQELEELLSQAASLSSEYRAMKEAVKEKRLDMEENARALARATRKAKRLVEAIETSTKAEAAAAKRVSPVGSRRGEAGAKPTSRRTAPKPTPPEGGPDA